MKHLKLFETYGKGIDYPDYYEWILKLLPEEQLFLIFYSAYIKLQDGRFYKGPSPAIEIEDETTKNVEPDEDGYGNFTIEMSTEVGEESLFASGEASFSGGFDKFYPATYDQPAEGGDYHMTDIDVEDIFLYNHIDDTEWTFVYKDELTTDCFTKEDLRGVIEEYAAYKVGNSEDDRKKSYNVVFPEKLKQKIDSLRNPDTATGYRLLNR